MKHNPPSVKRKIKIYESALLQFTDFDAVCICGSLNVAQNKLNLRGNAYGGYKYGTCSPERDSENNMLINFPEIVKHKSENASYSNFWWEVGTEEGKQIRINILKSEIAELKKKL